MKITLYLLVAVLCVALVTTCAAKTVDVGPDQAITTIAEGVNSASSGDTVMIHEGIYSINRSIDVGKSINIIGEGGNKTIIYTDSPDDINTVEEPAMIYVTADNVEIKNITFIGPCPDVDYQHEHGGTGFGGLSEARNAIKVQGAENVLIDNIYVTMILSDGVRVTESYKVTIINSKFECAGHDAISAFKSKNVVIDNCRMDEMINTCVRFDGSSQCSITNSTFMQSLAGTGGGYIELEHTVDDIKVCGNVFLPSSDPIWYLAYAEGGNVLAENNRVYGVSFGETGPYEITGENVVCDSYSETYGYGYNGTVTGKVIKFIDDGKDEHEKVVVVTNETCIETESNCTAVNETTECEESVCNTTVTFLDSLCMKYMDFSIESEMSAVNFTAESASDLENAKVLLNGTVEEQELGMMYLDAHDLKLQYARDMLNMSQNSSDEIRKRMGA
jgi:hypothetical protein